MAISSEYVMSNKAWRADLQAAYKVVAGRGTATEPFVLDLDVQGVTGDFLNRVAKGSAPNHITLYQITPSALSIFVRSAPWIDPTVKFIQMLPEEGYFFWYTHKKVFTFLWVMRK